MLMGRLEEKISDKKYSEGTEIDRTSKTYTINMVPDERALTILDVGCGTGLNSQKLAAKGHTIEGVDISEVAVKLYNERGFAGRTCDLAVGIPSPSEKYDLVFCSEVIEHIVDTELLLNEMYRVLKPGGELVLSTPNSAFWVYRILGLFGKTVSQVQHPGHVRFFSKKTLRDAVENSGFSIDRLCGRNIFLIFQTRSPESVWAKFFRLLGLNSEKRFTTGTYLFHISGFSNTARSFWSDTLIVRAKRALR